MENEMIELESEEMEIETEESCGSKVVKTVVVAGISAIVVGVAYKFVVKPVTSKVRSILKDKKNKKSVEVAQEQSNESDIED